MWFIKFLGSAVGRIVSMAVGTWLLVQGTTMSTLTGVMMVMTGVVLTMLGLTGIVVGLTGVGPVEHRTPVGR
jgi:hypothetical protein